MGYAVELCLDDCEAIMELFEATQSPIIKLGGSPHVSLAVFDEVDVVKLSSVLEKFTRETRQLAIRLQSVGLFPPPSSVVFLAPVVTRELLQIHSVLHGLLADAGLIGDQLYFPDSWVPHCTVTFDAPSDQILKSLDLAASAPVFKEFVVSKMTLVRFRPVEVISEFDLQLTE